MGKAAKGNNRISRRKLHQQAACDRFANHCQKYNVESLLKNCLGSTYRDLQNAYAMHACTYTQRYTQDRAGIYNNTRVAGTLWDTSKQKSGTTKWIVSWKSDMLKNILEKHGSTKNKTLTAQVVIKMQLLKRFIMSKSPTILPLKFQWGFGITTLFGISRGLRELVSTVFPAAWGIWYRHRFWNIEAWGIWYQHRFGYLKDLASTPFLVEIKKQVIWFPPINHGFLIIDCYLQGFQ